MKLFDLPDASLAHAVARVGMGINITLHGWTRLPDIPKFVHYMETQFAGSPIEGPLVKLSAWGIVAAESTIGPLVLLGLFLRPALFAGGVLMWVLLFGVCLIQKWDVAGSQLVYLAIFSALLATVKHDRLSLDAWRAARKA